MIAQTDSNSLIRVGHLSKYYPIRGQGLLRRDGGFIRAVDDVSFDVRRGETLGLVGESGCGKSTLGRVLIQLYKPTSGQVFFEDQELTSMNFEELRQLRKRMQIIFQDPYASLNPRMNVGSLVREPLDVFHVGRPSERQERVRELMSLVGLNEAFVDRFPHEFSGGQRQRIGVARALALQPDFIVCDEPISSLDVSIQAQIINLLKALQKRFALTYLFIAHDLSVVRYLSNRILVMYLGKTMELAPRSRLFNNPLHPYTQGLLSAVPVPDPVVERQRQRVILKGDLPSPMANVPGCRFHTRCPYAEPICRTVQPEWRQIVPEHWVACHLAERWLESPVQTSELVKAD